MYLANKISLSSILLACSFLIAVIISFHYILPDIIGSPGGYFPGGESVSVHIAMAKMILNGSILHPPNLIENFLFPASNHLLLALILLTRIPVNLFNVIGIAALFAVALYTGKIFNFTRIYAVFFAIALCSIYGILRYALAQQIDIWLLVWFLLTLILLYKPKPTMLYYVFLGFSSGMLFGSRYFTCVNLLILLILYYRNFFKYLTIKRFLIFACLVCILGVSWYIRNYIATGNPFYPQGFLMFKGACQNECYMNTVLKTVITHPAFIISAFISEYMIWSFAFVLLPIFSIITFITKQHKKFTTVNKLILLGMINILIYLFFPSSDVYHGVVSSVRYSFPIYGTFMLALFVLAKQLHYEKLLEIITFANISFLILPYPYHPKLLYLYVPIVTSVIYFLDKQAAKFYILKNARK